MREALSLGHTHIGTEDLLLALARVNDGVAARILLDSGVDAEKIRTAVVETLGPHRARSLERPRVLPRGRRIPGRGRGYALFARELLLLGWLLFAVALGLGILIGWLIWG